MSGEDFPVRKSCRRQIWSDSFLLGFFSAKGGLWTVIDGYEEEEEGDFFSSEKEKGAVVSPNL